jgi:Flp pilus assembly secretin CpaC
MASTLIDKIAEAGRNLSATAGTKLLGAIVGVGAEALENVLTSLQQPSLCFVPILSESLSLRRTVDIGTTMLITQADQKKDYITDNAAPRPRTWTGTGYISSLSPMLENGVLIKPTVQAQQAILEAAIDSRQKVKFKTDTGEVVDVLIQDLQIASSTKGAGVKRIQYTVQEVKVLQNSVLLGNLTELAGTVANNSVPVNTILNLGRNSAIMSTVTNVASSILGFKF